MRALGISLWLGLAASLAGQTGGREPEARLEAIVAAGGGSTYQTRALRVFYASNRRTNGV